MHVLFTVHTTPSLNREKRLRLLALTMFCDIVICPGYNKISSLALQGASISLLCVALSGYVETIYLRSFFATFGINFRVEAQVLSNLPLMYKFDKIRQNTLFNKDSFEPTIDYHGHVIVSQFFNGYSIGKYDIAPMIKVRVYLLFLFCLFFVFVLGLVFFKIVHVHVIVF